MNNCSYDLPKVKIRFKTTPSEFNRPSLDISKFDRFEASPTIFIDRLKHGKQIHESFMKNRKLKKHNYIK